MQVGRALYRLRTQLLKSLRVQYVDIVKAPTQPNLASTRIRFSLRGVTDDPVPAAALCDVQRFICALEQLLSGVGDALDA